MDTYHISVLPVEVIEYLRVKKGKWYVDATLGGGGHTKRIREAGGKVLGIDQDEDALAYVKNSQYAGAEELLLAHANFRDLDLVAAAHGITSVAGILFDLGVSSHQFDTAERGFSFQRNGPLDMRMNRDISVSAKDLVNGLTKQELADLFYKLGEEYRSRTIAQAIVNAREKKQIETTEELEKIVRHAVGSRFSPFGKKQSVHPATKVFQALRIVINDEIHSIEDALPKAWLMLENSGRIVIISFHSLEDRIVKNVFRDWEKAGKGNVITDKPIVPTESEIAQNPRARSSKLRVFEKNV